MAKRIIENGKYNIITCSDCGCKYAFDSTDIERDEVSAWVTCPQCGNPNTPEVRI